MPSAFPPTYLPGCKMRIGLFKKLLKALTRKNLVKDKIFFFLQLQQCYCKILCRDISALKPMCSTQQHTFFWVKARHRKKRVGGHYSSSPSALGVREPATSPTGSQTTLWKSHPSWWGVFANSALHQEFITHLMDKITPLGWISLSNINMPSTEQIHIATY